MNVVCIIPARGNSKGIHKKNIINFSGMPLISYSIKQAARSKYISKIYVSSDSQEILNISSEYGAEQIKRPENISGDYASSETALLHAIQDKKIDKNDIVVFLQATSPLRNFVDIDNAIEKLISTKSDSVFSACKIEDFFVWERKDSKLKSINYDHNNRKRRQDIPKQFVENGSIYVFKVSTFLNVKNRLCGKIECSYMDHWKVHEIDSMEDLELCEFLYNKRIKNE